MTFARVSRPCAFPKFALILTYSLSVYTWPAIWGWRAFLWTSPFTNTLSSFRSRIRTWMISPTCSSPVWSSESSCCNGRYGNYWYPLLLVHLTCKEKGDSNRASGAFANSNFPRAFVSQFQENEEGSWSWYCIVILRWYAKTKKYMFPWVLCSQTSGGYSTPAESGGGNGIASMGPQIRGHGICKEISSCEMRPYTLVK